MLGGQVGLVIKAQGGGGFRVWLVFGGSIGLPSSVLFIVRWPC